MLTAIIVVFAFIIVSGCYLWVFNCLMIRGNTYLIMSENERKRNREQIEKNREINDMSLEHVCPNDGSIMLRMPINKKHSYCSVCGEHYQDGKFWTSSEWAQMINNNYFSKVRN